MKPKLKPPGIQHLKIKCDILVLTFAFKFNSRRYSTADPEAGAAMENQMVVAAEEKAKATLAARPDVIHLHKVMTNCVKCYEEM
jgi:hypothetical protein